MSTPFLIILTLWTLLVCICIHLNYKAIRALEEHRLKQHDIMVEIQKKINNIKETE